MKYGIGIVAFCGLIFARTYAPVAGAATDIGPADVEVLFYNIRGLPPFITRDNSYARAHALLGRLKQYPIVCFQEQFVFEGLAKKILSDAAHFTGSPSRWKMRSWFLRPFCGGCGSGLMTIVRPRKNLFRVHSHRSVSFGNICSGWLGNKADCWATKGFQAIQIEMANGGDVILYNIHLDAGGSDRRTRERQLAIVAEDIRVFVPAESGLVIGGDFNASSADLESFAVPAKLKLADIAGAASSRKRIIDHVFFRDGTKTRLILQNAVMLHEYTGLSDHLPLMASFTVSRR